MKFITLYKRWMEEGQMPSAGLCSSLPDSLLDSEEFDLCSANHEEAMKSGEEGGGYAWWGIENMEVEGFYELTPLRQNIMLLCACMKEEY